MLAEVRDHLGPEHCSDAVAECRQAGGQLLLERTAEAAALARLVIVLVIWMKR